MGPDEVSHLITSQPPLPLTHTLLKKNQLLFPFLPFLPPPSLTHKYNPLAFPIDSPLLTNHSLLLTSTLFSWSSVLNLTALQLPSTVSFNLLPPLVWNDFWFTATGQTPNNHESSTSLQPNVAARDEAFRELSCLASRQARVSARRN